MDIDNNYKLKYMLNDKEKLFNLIDYDPVIVTKHFLHVGDNYESIITRIDDNNNYDQFFFTNKKKEGNEVVDNFKVIISSDQFYQISKNLNTDPIVKVSQDFKLHDYSATWHGYTSIKTDLITIDFDSQEDVNSFRPPEFLSEKVNLSDKYFWLTLNDMEVSA